jgi:hypothetical protein
MTQEKENFKHKHAKSAWLSAGEDLILLTKLIDIGLEQGSIDEFMLEGRYSIMVEEIGSPPEGMADYRSLVPLTYQIYNSIEMLLKGYEYAAFPNDQLKSVPKLIWLLQRFEQYNYVQDATVAAYVRKYVDDASIPALLRDFLTESGLGVSHLINARRFINNNNFFSAVSNYKPYYFDYERGRAFFAELNGDVRPVLSHVEQLFANIDDDGNPGELVRSLQVS